MVDEDRRYGITRNYWPKGEADLFWRAFSTGAITQDGRLGDKAAIDTWIADDAIISAKTKIEEYTLVLEKFEKGIAQAGAQLADRKDQVEKEIQKIKKVISALEAEVKRLDELRRNAKYPYTFETWKTPDAKKPETPKLPEFNDVCEPEKQDQQSGKRQAEFAMRDTRWQSIM